MQARMVKLRKTVALLVLTAVIVIGVMSVAGCGSDDSGGEAAVAAPAVVGMTVSKAMASLDRAQPDLGETALVRNKSGSALSSGQYDPDKAIVVKQAPPMGETVPGDGSFFLIIDAPDNPPTSGNPGVEEDEYPVPGKYYLRGDDNSPDYFLLKKDGTYTRSKDGGKGGKAIFHGTYMTRSDSLVINPPTSNNGTAGNNGYKMESFDYEWIVKGQSFFHQVAGLNNQPRVIEYRKTG